MEKYDYLVSVIEYKSFSFELDLMKMLFEYIFKIEFAYHFHFLDVLAETKSLIFRRLTTVGIVCLTVRFLLDFKGEMT